MRFAVHRQSPRGGPYHLMAGQNPIYIFTLQNGGNTP